MPTGLSFFIKDNTFSGDRKRIARGLDMMPRKQLKL